MREGTLEPPKSRQTTCRVVADYQAAYPEPIVVRAGEGLVVGQEDLEYPGWIWCTDGSGKGGWVPDDWYRAQGRKCQGAIRLRGHRVVGKCGRRVDYNQRKRWLGMVYKRERSKRLATCRKSGEEE